MQKSDTTKFTLLMGELFVAFQVEPSIELLRVYEKYLSDCNSYQIERAVAKLIKTEDRFPSVAKLRDTALALPTESAQERYRAMLLPV